MRMHGVTLFLFASVIVAAPLGHMTAVAQQQSMRLAEPRLAIGGHDPVSYFTERRPARGSPEFTFVWDDARYQFASAANRDRFAADPDRYAPQYAGYCANGMAARSKVEPSPQYWVIYDGRLLLFSNAQGGNRFAGPKGAELVRQADRNWDSRRH